jgi:hypothetical protein
MEVFQRIGRAVEQRWRAKDYDEEALPELAGAVLDAELPGGTGAEEVLRWLLATDTIPQQLDPTSKFGQPPITLYRGPRFFIGALCWMDGTTEIHQHGFTGAFHVLHGSSVHTRYRFELEERVTSALLLGQVRFRDFELLGAGDTRPILSGDRAIHALFHLDRPSVSIVVRTLREPRGGPQYTYFPPSLAEDPFNEDPLLLRRIEALVVLHAMAPERHEEAVGALLAGGDLQTVFKVALHHMATVKDLDQTRGLLERARPRHGARVDRLWPVLEESARVRALVAKRALLTEADPRFFLAMLMNLPTRAAIVEAVGRRYPGADAAARIAEWTGELADAILGDEAAGGEDEDHTMAVFAEMLRGHQGEGLIERLKQEYDAGDVEDLRGTIAEIERTLRAAPLLKPLFA